MDNNKVTFSPEYEKEFYSVESIFKALEKHRSVAVLGIEIKVNEQIFSYIGSARYPKNKFLILDGKVFSGLSILDNVLFHADRKILSGKKESVDRLREFCRQYELPLDFNISARDLPIDTQKLLNLLSAYYAQMDCVVIEDCMADMSLRGASVYCDILERMKAAGCKIIYLTTRWEDAVKIADWLMIISNGVLERTFDADFVRNNPRELIQLLGSGVYHNEDSRTTMYEQAMEAMVQATDMISGSRNSSSLEDITGIIRKSLNATGSFLYLNSSDAVVEVPQGKASGLNFPKLYENTIHAKHNQFYWSIRDRWYADLFLDKSDMLQSVIAVPIVYHNDFLGICGVWFETVFLYSQENLLTLSTLANEIVILLETSRLMNRSLLLQESHHRIKNNLQMIISLLYIQRDQWQNENRFAQAIDSTVGRIKSVSIVHDILSGDTFGAGSVKLGDLTDCILKMYKNTGINFEVKIEPVFVIQKFAVSIALVLNELLSNCFKHAFTGLPPEYPKKAVISICTKDDMLIMRVKDNGIGIPPRMSGDSNETRSLGMTIIHTLVENDMDGTITFESQEGASAIVQCPIGQKFTKFLM